MEDLLYYEEDIEEYDDWFSEVVAMHKEAREKLYG
jgi:hypothetical protein